MSIPRVRRLRRRTRQEIDDAFALWRLRFYVWGRLLMLGVLTAQAAEAVLALIEGRPPHLAAPSLRTLADWLRGRGG